MEKIDVGLHQQEIILWGRSGRVQVPHFSLTRDSSSIGRALQHEGILLLNALDIGSRPVYLATKREHFASFISDNSPERSRGYYDSAILRGISVQRLARQPSKLKVRVQISYIAP